MGSCVVWLSNVCDIGRFRCRFGDWDHLDVLFALLTNIIRYMKKGECLLDLNKGSC